jgi:hypothetical protein
VQHRDIKLAFRILRLENMGTSLHHDAEDALTGFRFGPSLRQLFNRIDAIHAEGRFGSAEEISDHYPSLKDSDADLVNLGNGACGTMRVIRIFQQTSPHSFSEMRAADATSKISRAAA